MAPPSDVRPEPADEATEHRHAVARVALYRLAATGTVDVIRDGASLLVRQGDVAVRVRPGADAHIARREDDLARRLLADGVPVTPLVGDLQPWPVDGCSVTGWRWCPAVRPARSADLGDLVRALRTRTAPGGPGELSPFAPLGHVLDVVADDDDPHAAFVRRRAGELAEPLAAATADDPLGPCVVHGDLHRGNVVVAEEGPLLTDLELGGWGPASYDVATAVVAVRRYGAPVDGLGRFLDRAGVDPRTWPGFETLVEVNELWVTAWAVSVAHRHPEWAAEAARRVETLRDGAEHVWQLS